MARSPILGPSPGRGGGPLALRQARQTISCCVYTITCREISEELVAAHRRGVQVRVVTEDEKMDDKGSKTMNLRSQGISVRKDGRGLMHHKVR